LIKTLTCNYGKSIIINKEVKKVGKWITVEVPEEVHTKVRIKTFQENKTVKNYVLQLILKDLHTKKE